MAHFWKNEHFPDNSYRIISFALLIIIWRGQSWVSPTESYKLKIMKISPTEYEEFVIFQLLKPGSFPDWIWKILYCWNFPNWKINLILRFPRLYNLNFKFRNSPTESYKFLKAWIIIRQVKFLKSGSYTIRDWWYTNLKLESFPDWAEFWKLLGWCRPADYCFLVQSCLPSSYFSLPLIFNKSPIVVSWIS